MRVDRTFAFLDLCGFTSFNETAGDDAAVAVLARLRAIVRAASERHGVRLTKWLGDGVMLSGIDAAAVAACATEVLDRVGMCGPLALRGGLARGEVIMFEGDDYVGAAVNTAARLCREAKPHCILAEVSLFTDEEMRDTIPPTLRRVALDGITRPVLICEMASGARRAVSGHSAERALP